MQDDAGATPIPTGELAAPARRALTGAGYTTLERLAESDEAVVGDRHGIGPSTLDTLREALERTTSPSRRSSDVDTVDVVLENEVDVVLENEVAVNSTFPYGGHQT